MEKIYDCIIIGGGAAGLSAAVCLKQIDRSFNIAILEQLPRVGKKLITTGNGRCNITNLNLDINRFHGENLPFIEELISRYDNIYIEDFFASLGIVITYDETGRAYPYSLQASAVVDALRLSADQMEVSTLLEKTVTDFSKTGDIFTVKTEAECFRARAVLIACGLYSGGKKLGSDGKMFRLLKEKGYSASKVTPAIVQLKCASSLPRSLKGIKVNAAATLFIDKKAVRSDMGEVLFCDYGLSGPPIMQISREVERRDGKKEVILDLMPEYSKEKVIELLNFRVGALRGRSLEDFMSGMLNKRVGQAILKIAGKTLNESVDGLNASDIYTIASLIKKLSFEITATTGFDNSQVTAGGILLREFDSKNMMSKKQSGLFAAGEILDADGDCGGFNLQWAWSSAICAAEGIAQYLG